ncbi:hypothetical protein M8J76_014064 [Diaphorina citri]|nr:hypothetical protein M8J75_012208 [Diaphorina citri]KAI5727095.1 hypothetical protein M8J76_014064 [Diaphorina citri]
MDPVGPWSAYAAQYNRLATAGPGSGDFIASHHLAATGNSGLSSHQAGGNIPSTTSQLLLHAAAHATSSLAGASSAFNPGSFLSPSGYETVFSPLFHHANPKAHVNTASLTSQHRQALESASKQSNIVESDINQLRENYNSAHQQSLHAASFFDHQNPTSQSASITWAQGNAQLPSPFGILPHENIPNSPGGSSKSASAYDSHFLTAQTLNHLTTFNNENKKLARSSSSGQSKNHSSSPTNNSYYSNSTHKSNSSSTTTSTPSTSTSSSSSRNTQESIKTKTNSKSPAATSVSPATCSPPTCTNSTKTTSSSNSSSAITTTSSPIIPTTTTPISAASVSSNNSSNYSATTCKAFSSNTNSTCIVTSPSRIPQAPLTRISNIFTNSSQRQTDKQSSRSTSFPSPVSKQTPLSSKSQSERKSESNHETSQSSPISFALIDSNSRQNVNFSNVNANNSKMNSSNSRVIHPGTAQQFQQQSTNNASPTSYTDPQYRISSKNTSLSGGDSAYSSGSSTASNSDCAVPSRKPSPLHSHSQASPVGAAYPVYNSPMNAISSPQQQQATHSESSGYNKQQMTSPSPLDVTVSRPPSQSNQVAYPSVITRTDNKSYPYERSQEFPQKQQTCWDSSERQQVRSSKQYSIPNNYVESNQHVQKAVVLGITERQQAYFDSTPSHQVTLQDLSSRGDPMSIVKNLQTLQQHHQQNQQPAAPVAPQAQPVQHQPQQQTQQAAQHQITQHSTTAAPSVSQQKTASNFEELRAPVNNKSSARRRKSSERSNHSIGGDITSTTTISEYFSGRVPPPAHHNISQQQQNGTYFDFERWNLPPANPKMFAGQGAFGGQNSISHGSNFVGNSAHQHQSLMVPHPHHHPSPLSYFPPFHLSHHTTHPEYQNSPNAVETYGNDSQGTSSSSSNNYVPSIEAQPKVIVPNIEEELGFLSESVPAAPQAAYSYSGTDANKETTKTSLGVTTSKNDFLASYLKFLQGERDTSPPGVRPSGGGAGPRKPTWSRSRVTTTNPTGNAAPESSDPSAAAVTLIQPTVKPKPEPKYDPQDDPRYFPLPKSSADRRRHLDSSSDSDSDLDTKKSKLSDWSLPSSKKKDQQKLLPKPKLDKPKKIFDKPKKDFGRERQELFKKKKPSSSMPAEEKPPPRREMSKRKAKEKTKMTVDGAQEEDDYYEEHDSDSDPAWTPQATKDEPEDDLSIKKIKGGKNRFPSLMSMAPSSGIKKRRIEDGPENKLKPIIKSEDDDSASGPSGSGNGAATELEGTNFKTGEFVALRSEIYKDYPALWRVDGKSLLQKYEPFETKSGAIHYRNISTYSGFTSNNRQYYEKVNVKVHYENRNETVVELLNKAPSEKVTRPKHPDILEPYAKETLKYQDNFEVYIQTLISQALDTNFLTEIFQEKDEYFLSNVRTIDNLTESKKMLLVQASKWQNALIAESITTWPCYNVIADLTHLEKLNKYCAGCAKPQDLLMCLKCIEHVELLSKVAHQKYLMFIECAKRVNEKRSSDETKDTTVILNELLADEVWLNKLFTDVRYDWAQIDNIAFNST